MRRLLIALCVVTLTGCKYGPEHALPPPVTERLPNSKDDYKANNRIGFDLLYTTEPSGMNPIVGPLATTCLLKVLLNGSSGSAHDQLLSTLSTSEEQSDEFDDGQRALLNQVNSYRDRTVMLGSALWSIWPTVLDKKFVSDAGAKNAVTVKKLGGTGIEAVRLVNEFANERTNGRITELVDKLSRSDQIFGTVVSSVEWKGAPFVGTKKMRFSGKEVQAMRVNGRYHHYSDARYASVSLPMGDCDLDIVVPKGETTLDNLGDVLNESAWSLLKASMVETEIEVVLPLLDFSGSSDLQKPVSELGAPALFESGCNLRRMSLEMEKGYRLSEIKESYSVKITPSGDARSENIKTFPFTLNVDRPFFMAVTDSKTGAILLMGFVHQPSGQ